MSLSNNTEIKNPSVRTYQWDGDKGGFNYYDKEQKKKIHVEMPFQFIVLDRLHTVRGFDDSAQSGYWANEIRDFKKETLTIRNKDGVCATGLYEDAIKQCTGAKYSQSVYIAFKEGDKLVICNLQLMGAAIGPWIEFSKKADIYKCAVSVNEMVEGKKGKVVYQSPVFKSLPISDPTREKAVELDKVLQEYLKAYFIRQSSVVSEVPKEATLESDIKAGQEAVVAHEESTDDLPF